MIRIKCKGCGKHFHLPDSQEGTCTTCPACTAKEKASKSPGSEQKRERVKVGAGQDAGTPTDILGLGDVGADAGPKLKPELRPKLKPELRPKLPAKPRKPLRPVQRPDADRSRGMGAVGTESLGTVALRPGAPDRADLGPDALDLDDAPDLDLTIETVPERNFEPRAEDAIRRFHLLWIGLAIAASFFMPILGLPNQAVVVPELSSEVGVFSGETTGLALAVMLLPLIIGGAVMALSRMFDPPMRSVAITLAGLSLFGLFLADEDARSTITESLHVVPSSLNLSVILWLVGAIGLLASVRARWYRPVHLPTYLLGAISGASYITYMFLPEDSLLSMGRGPVAQAIAMIEFDAATASAILSTMAFMAAAALVCLVNLPFKNGHKAAKRSRLAFRLLLAAFVVPILILVIRFLTLPDDPAMLSMSTMPGFGQPPAMLFISMGIKYAVMFGGILLLIPIGIADLFAGRTDTD